MDRTFIDFLDGLSSSDDWDTAWQRFEDFCAGYGVRYVTHLEVSPEHVDADSVSYRVNMPPEWIERYMEQNYVPHDPAVNFALKSQSPCLFKRSVSLEKDLWTKQQIQIAQEAREFGLGDGIIIPYFGYKGDVQGSITMFVEQDNPTATGDMEQYAERLMLNALMMHIWYANRRSAKNTSVNITSRQREVIQWIAKGLHNDQIADKMNISYDGVSYFMREIKNRLGVRTHREIVPKAIQLGLVEI